MAIKRNESELDALQRAFLIGSTDRIQAIEGIILNLEHASDSETFADLKRQVLGLVHSFKGSASAYHLNCLSSICHTLEDVLISSKNQAPTSKPTQLDDISVMLKVLDLLTEYVEAYLSLGELPNSQVFSKKLDQIINSNFINLKKDFATPQKKYIGQVLLNLSSHAIEKQLTTYFESIDIQVHSSNNSLQCLDLLMHHKFDIFIASNQISPVEGSKLFSMIKQSGLEKIPLLVLLTSDTKLLHSRKGDADYIIEKNDHLIDWIQKVTEFTIHTKFSLSNISSNLSHVKRIFIIDDDPDMIEMYKIAFSRSKNQEFFYSSCPEKAKQQIIEFQPNLIISDLNMPKISGTDLIKQLKANSDSSQIPVLFITGDIRSESAQQALELDALAIIDKNMISPKFPTWLWSYLIHLETQRSHHFRIAQ